MDYLQAFGEGLIVGIGAALAIENWQDIFDIALELGTYVFGGAIKGLLKVVELTVGIVAVIGAILSVGSALMNLISSGDITGIINLAGVLVGGLMTGILINGKIQDVIEDGVAKIRKLAGVGDVFGSLRRSGIDIPPNIQQYINKAFSNAKATDDLEEIGKIIKRNPEVVTKITGDISEIDSADVRKIVKAVDERGIRFSGEEYNYLKNTDKISSSNKIDVDKYLEYDLGRYGKRELDLGIDPGGKRLVPEEIDTALEVENTKGIVLKRHPNPELDWVSDNKSYGALDSEINASNNQYLNLEYFKLQIDKHISKSDISVYDLRGLTETQFIEINNYIQVKNLNANQFILLR